MFNFECFAFTLLITLTTSFAIDGSLPIRNDENTMYPSVKGHSNQVNLDNDQIQKRQSSLGKSIPSSTGAGIRKNRVENVENEILSDEGLNSIFEYEEDEVIPVKKTLKDSEKYDKIENTMKDLKNDNGKFQKDVNYLPIDKKSSNELMGDGITTVAPSNRKYSEELMGDGIGTIVLRDGKYLSESMDDGVSTVSSVNWKSRTESTDDGVSTIEPVEENYRSEFTSEEINSPLSVDGKFTNESMDNSVTYHISNETASLKVESTKSSIIENLNSQLMLNVKLQKKYLTNTSASTKIKNTTLSSKISILPEKSKRLVNTLIASTPQTENMPKTLHTKYPNSASQESNSNFKNIKDNSSSSPKLSSVSHETKLIRSKSPISKEQYQLSLKDVSDAPLLFNNSDSGDYNSTTSDYSTISIQNERENSTTNLSLSFKNQNETNVSVLNTTFGPATDTDSTTELITANDTSDSDLEQTQNLTLSSSALESPSSSQLSFSTKTLSFTTTGRRQVNQANSMSNVSTSIENVINDQNHSTFAPSSTKETTHSSRSISQQTLISTASSSLDFISFPTKTSSIFLKKRVPSERRIEISDKEEIDIYWICPPGDEYLGDKDSEYDWYKIKSEPGSYTHPLPKIKDLTTKKFILQIKGLSNTNGGRYFCTSQDSSPFATTKMYFYQIVVLNSRWINVGSVSTAILYVNQKAIINCPYGDMIKNKVPTNEGCCSSRISIMDISISSSTDLYQCSDSNKTTVKLPAISSSTNCSLALNGCEFQTTSRCNHSESDCSNTSEAIETDRCRFNNVNYLNSPQTLKRCPGSIHIRFYYDMSKEKCFPFETDICEEDYFTFSTLKECDETCSKIPSSIEKCLYPRNPDESHLCTERNLTGKYLTYFDIETRSCKWFYHCNQSRLTRNVFRSLSMCNVNCLNNRKRILIESIKACRYERFTENSIFSWSYNKQFGKCEMSPGITKNKLKFSNKDNCENVCKIYGSKEICDSRPENGHCQPNRMKWHFHLPSKRCLKILDGGCGESLNRFSSKSMCERICMKFMNQKLPDLSTISTKSSTRTPTTKSMAKKTQKITTLRVEEITSQRNLEVRLTVKSVNISKVSIQFNASDRELDFEPCKKDPISIICEFGLNRQRFESHRYTFHWKTATCDRTLFSGCRSTENLFDDSNDCKSACEYRWHATLKYPDCQNPINFNCMAPDASGNAKALRRYFYQSSTRECVPFTSVNNSQCLNQYFTSRTKCFQTCKPDPPTELLLQNRCFGKVVLSDSSCSEDQKVDRWFYMQSIDQCLQYKTCPVNYPGNMFSMKEECDNSCRASNITSVCGLPMDPGVGNRMKSKYFYNRLRGKCQLFLYGGSLGNLNRFDSKIECQRFCIVINDNTEELKVSSLVVDDYHYKEFIGTRSNQMWLKESLDREYCYDSHRYGECRDNQQEVFIKKYSYDSYSKRCEAYMFSGCGSVSRNSFDSVAICDKMCTERITKTVSSHCSPMDSKCPDSPYVYWAYNSQQGICQRYTSCNKVSSYQFNFKNESHCSQICAPVLPMKKDIFDICHLPPTINKNCTVLSERWYHNHLTESCYSLFSCKQYGNNFPSLASCKAACQPDSLKDVCQLPMDKGPCDDNQTLSYYFDWSSQICKLFSYGGCLGNRNRFRTIHECQSVCPSENQCNIKLNDPRKCHPLNLNPVSNIYRFDNKLGKCQHVENFTCGDHTKYFETAEQCTKYCVVPVEYQLIQYTDIKDLPEWQQPNCVEPLLFNTYPVCTKYDEWLPRFYYNQKQGDCAFFYYNGCDGVEDKGNRFTSVLECTTQCLKYSTIKGMVSTIRQTTRTHYLTPPFPLRISQNLLNNLTLKSPVKPGLCPDSNYQCSQVQENSIKCESDMDCQYLWKCCPCEMSHSILSMCIEPLNCMTTKYGCCADGITFASDNLHLNCKGNRPTIVELLPEIIDNYSENELVLNCQVSGDPKPFISWIYLDNNSLAFDPRSVDLDLIQPFWSGQIKLLRSYYFFGLWLCRVNNELGMDEKEVYISRSKFKTPFMRKYLPEPSDKLSINVTVDHRVTLHCPIYGIPRPTITWFLNKIMINESSWSISIFGRYLIIENAKYIHSGIWSCVASNGYLSLTHKVRLRILEAIQIFPPPMGTTIKTNLGHQVILFCNVQVEGYRSISWYWETGANKTKLNSTLEFESRILKVSEFRNPYNGNYVCEADNIVSHAILKYKIVPYNIDEISINPSGALFVGTTVVLKCPQRPSDASGFIVWKKDGNLLDVKSIKLKLDLKSQSDSGFYSCLQNNRNFMTYLYIFNLPPNRR